MQRIRVGIAGLGVVGSEVVRGIQDRLSNSIEIVAVSARDRGKQRPVDISEYDWVSSPTELALRGDIDVVIELMGGANDARNLVTTALNNDIHVITANKNLIATHGHELSNIAQKTGAVLAFEAAVGGGIDIVKPLQQRVQVGIIHNIRGIFNGTCNYILWRMEQGLSFDAALAEAQEKGYAETPDPSADTKGMDAAYKIAIMSGICFGQMPEMGAFPVKGIENISLKNIQDARSCGNKIKLVARASYLPDEVFASVGPEELGPDDPLYHVDDVDNIFVIKSDSGEYVYQGPGAGGKATASAVLSDLLRIRDGARPLAFPLGLVVA